MSLFYASSPSHLFSLSLHDALPILFISIVPVLFSVIYTSVLTVKDLEYVNENNIDLFDYLYYTFSISYSLPEKDRKSTRLNSSHVAISYAVFCLKNKNYNLINCYIC